MEYLLAFLVLLYAVWFIYCFNFFRKEAGLKPHEKAYWVFLLLAFPLITMTIYSLVNRNERRRFTSGNTQA